MKQYLSLLQKLLNEGQRKEDRTQTGTLSLFGQQMRFDLSEGFPLLTTKKVYMRGITHELLWFLKGDTNIRYLQKNNVNIWNEWADENGDLGPVYGKQWRDFLGVDQMKNVIDQIQTNPTSRRLIVSAWNPVDVPCMALPPCHCFFQFYVLNSKLSCQLYQRSADFFLGVPFNIASYSLLTHMIAHVCGLGVGEFVHTFGDVHLYLNHMQQALTQLKRKPDALPQLRLNPKIKDIFNFCFEDIEVLNYKPQEAIKAPIAV